MAKFTMEQTMAVAAIQQQINDWAYELDINNGLEIATLVSPDVRYTVGGTTYEGPEGVRSFYQGRLDRLSAASGAPVQRHAISTLRVAFESDDFATTTFSLIYFTTAGVTSGTEHADPAAVADVRMNFSRGADGEWLIAMFDSGQTFRRTAEYARVS